MIKIAIVEDDKEFADYLRECILKYEKNQLGKGAECFGIDVFFTGMDFVDKFKSDYDIVFMDIQLPEMNGFDAAKYLYSLDKSVCIIFVTNLAQYAIKGYEVEALDYVLKPVEYANIADKLDKALKKIALKKKNETLLLKENYVARLPIGDILYIEVVGHNLIYHTKTQIYELRGNMKDKEAELGEFGFSRCNNCYLVNLMHVNKLDKYTVNVGDVELAVSRKRMKNFMKAFLTFLGKEA